MFYNLAGGIRMKTISVRWDGGIRGKNSGGMQDCKSLFWTLKQMHILTGLEPSFWNSTEN